MDYKIHRCKIVMDIDHAEYNQTMMQCRSIFHESLKFDCEDIIREIVSGYKGNVNINSLNIDLGRFSYNTFESQFRSRFIQAFRGQLAEHCVKLRSMKQEAESQTASGDAEQVFTRYLHCGCWPYAEKWQQDPASWLLEQLMDNKEKWHTFLLSACLQALPRYRLRLLLEQNHALQYYCRWPTQDENILLYALRYFQCNPHLHDRYLLDPGETLPQFDCTRAETLQLLTPLLTGSTSTPGKDAPGFNQWVRRLLQQKAVRKLAEQVAQGKAHSSEKGALKKPLSTLKVASPNVNLESMPICNAGLVTLWPLLPNLFQRLGLCEKSQFVSESARYQAACWLDWIAWQEEEPQSQRMAFSRWLCGLEIEEEQEFYPLEAEKLGVAQEWLTQLPEQLAGWKALRTPDVCKLFLQRPGNLINRGGSLVLDIESEPWDLMLREWPWSFSRMALPWRPEGLDVDWPIP